MIGTQKVIKYCAIAFAMLLIFGIISGIVYSISSITGVVSIAIDRDDDEEVRNLDMEGNFNILDINIKAANLVIKTGDSFKAETTNKYIECNVSDEKLFIREKSHMKLGNDAKLIVYIPSDMILDKVSIKTGAGKVIIESLNAQNLYLNLGAGKVDIDSLNVTKTAKIDGGAGSFDIQNGIINNLSLDMGVGKVSLNLSLRGYNKIDAGVGKINLNLLDALDNYKFKLDKGVGAITINGTNFTDNTSIGIGDHVIDIDGGVGKIEVNTKNN